MNKKWKISSTLLPTLLPSLLPYILPFSVFQSISVQTSSILFSMFHTSSMFLDTINKATYLCLAQCTHTICFSIYTFLSHLIFGYGILLPYSMEKFFQPFPFFSHYSSFINGKNLSKNFPSGFHIFSNYYGKIIVQKFSIVFPFFLVIF